jgi:RNA polymerase sigma-70 factor, ECF subfamily
MATSETHHFEQEALSHLPALLALARRLTRSLPEAEDLVQETLLKALRARAQYEPGTHLKAWLFKILRNTFINRYHRGQLERSMVTAAVPDPVSDGWMSTASLRSLREADGALRAELQSKLAAALDKIPEEFRVVVVFADVEEMSYREIADTLDCPIGTVMSRLHRGRRLLRTHLFQEARDLGILVPEDFIGPSTEAAAGQDPMTQEQPAVEAPAHPEEPIDLGAYRDAAGKRGSR